MKKIKIKTSALQIATLIQLEMIAHDYLGIRASLSDVSYSKCGDFKISDNVHVNSNDGVYNDTKEAFSKIGVSISGTEYVRVLDSYFLEILLDKIEHSIEGRLSIEEILEVDAFSTYSYRDTDNLFDLGLKDNTTIQYIDLTEFKNLYWIGNNICTGMTALETLVFPDCPITLDTVYDDAVNAFGGATSLKNFTILNTVYVLNGNPFLNWTSLQNIYIKSVEIFLKMYYNTAHSGYHGIAYYSNHVVSLYVTSDTENPLGTESNPFVIPKSITTIHGYALYNLRSIEFISFEGTTEEYKAITRGTSWHYNVPCAQVYCIASDEYVGIDDVTEETTE